MLQRKILSLSNLSLIESETIFSRKIILEKRLVIYCFGFMPGDFQVICGSMEISITFDTFFCTNSVCFVEIPL